MSVNEHLIFVLSFQIVVFVFYEEGCKKDSSMNNYLGK